MNRQKLSQQVMGAMLIMLLSVGCGTLAATPTPISPTATPTPVPPTPMPGIEVAVDIGGTLVRVTEVNFGRYVGTRVTDNKEDLGLLGGYEAEAGFRFVEVVIEVIQGASTEEVSQWAVNLRDSEGNNYEAVVRGRGLFYDNMNNVGWTFSVPESAAQLVLIFPGGVSVDLMPLTGK